MCLISEDNTRKILTNSGGIIRLIQSLETKSSSQRRKLKGRINETEVCNICKKEKEKKEIKEMTCFNCCFFVLRFKAEVEKVLGSFVEKEDEHIKEVRETISVELCI